MLPAFAKLTERATAMGWRAPAAAGVGVAAVLALALGFGAARSSPVGPAAGARRVAAVTGGDLSQAAFRTLLSRMDPAAVDLARRFDPLERTAEPSMFSFSAADIPTLFAFQPIEGEAARRINGAIPFADGQVLPAAPFVLAARSPAERERAVRCLTNAIYYEAALEPLDGRRAVAQVVLNRVRDPNFPKSICGVVYEGWERLTGCQFSFTCDGSLVRDPIPVLWKEDREVAEAALDGYVMTEVGTATHYHADYVAPYWAPALVKLTQVGSHIFYRWPGDAGLPRAFNASYQGGELRLSEAVLTGKAPRPAAIPAQTQPGAGGAGLPGLPGTSLPGLPALRTVTVADAGGAVKTRVTATFEPAQYGRRAPTPEEIARINAMLEQRFPSKPEASAAAPAEPLAVSANPAAPAG
jgi:hypothetical protein